MSWWEGRRVLVTGCSGFVGRWLTRELVERGATVVGLVRDSVPEFERLLQGPLRMVTVVRGGVEDSGLVERTFNEYHIEVCLHLAAQSLVGTANRNPSSTFQTNILGTWNVLEAARRLARGTRIIVASSDKAYGHPTQLPLTEEMPLAGRHPYDVSKSCADLLAQAYVATYDLPIGIVRCGNIYGEGDVNFNRIVPETMRALIRDEPPPIRSDGTFVRDYLYIGDAVSAYMVLAERLEDPSVRGEAFNFSSERPMSVLELVHLMIHASGKTHLEPRILGTATAEIREQYLSCAKARRILDWSAQVSIEDGLAKAYRWYEQYLHEVEGSREARCLPADKK